MVLDAGNDGVEGTGLAAPKAKHGGAGIEGTASIEEITGSNKVNLDGVSISDSNPSTSGSHAPTSTSSTQHGNEAWRQALNAQASQNNSGQGR